MDNAIANFSYLTISLSGIWLLSALPSLAQVIPDDTLGNEQSLVNPRDETSNSIDGGAIRGQNLFHSFQEFNVNEGRGVYFSNPDAVSNIFSRVTGNNASNILGTLGVDGTADLFLINPNGIIFGENASLDVQGSFAATTANGIRFGEQGVFDTTNPQAAQLLTINPSAYLFNQIEESASIESQSLVAAGETSQGTKVRGIRVPDGQDLFLLGGDITLDSSRLNAFGGRVELGGLKATGEVGINSDGSLMFPENVARGDVSLTNRSRVDVKGDRGSIKVEAGNINISDLSFLFAGIESNSEIVNGQAGDIILNATDNIKILDNSSIRNSVGFNATGNAGNIKIMANSLLLNDAIINSNVSGSNSVLNITAGQGNTGDISFQANDSITVQASSITNLLSNEAKGNGGDITIETGSLSLTEGSSVSITHDGEGNLGNINIQTKDSILISGTATDPFAPPTLISNSTNPINALIDSRQGGNITIDARSISLTEEASINSISGGEVKLIATDTIKLSNGSVIDTRSVNGDSITINTNNLELLSDSFLISGTKEELGLANTQVGNININAAGNIILEAGEITNLIAFSSQGIGGDINIQADSLVLKNPSLDPLRSQIKAQNNSIGNGGNINIDVRQLTLQEGSFISTSTFPSATGKGGNLKINASESVELIGNAAVESPPTSLLSQSGGMGDSGNIIVETNKLIVRDGAGISTQTFDEGEGGNLTIISPSVKLIGTSSTNTSSGLFSITSGLFTQNQAGNAGNIEIISDELIIQDGAFIDASTTSEGRAGDININASNVLTISGSSFQDTPSAIFTAVFVNPDTGIIATGSAGNLTIETEQLIIQDRGQITADTQSVGNAGLIKVLATEVFLSESGLINTSSSGTGNAGNITLKYY